MNKNKFHYVICVFFLSFAVFIDALQYTPALPARIKGRKQDSNLPKRAEKYINLFVPVGEESLAMRILSSEPIKQMVDFKQKKQELETTKETNNVYIYDESKNDGYLLTENMWSKSKTLKALMGDFESEGQKLYSIVHSYPYSADVIKTICYILKVCENASKENPCNDLVENIIENINFQTILPALICAHDDLDIDTYIIAELFKKVEQKIADLLNGHVVSAEDIKALDKMSLGSDLRKQLLGIKWEIFVEKFKLSVIKKCSFINPDNQPKPYTYGEDGDCIFDILFSPNNKYLSLNYREWEEFSRLGTFLVLRSSSVINMSTMYELKKVEKSNPLMWIDNDTFICSGSAPQSLKIFNCNGDEVAEKREFKLTHNLFDVDIAHHGQGNIIFTAWDSRTGIYIGALNCNGSADTVKYLDLKGIQGTYSKFIKEDSGGIEMVFKNQKNSNGIGLYKLAAGKPSDAQQMAKLDEIVTFDGIDDSVVINQNKSKLAAIVGKDRLNIGIYSFEKKSYTLFKGNKEISSLAFSPDGKIIIAACVGELFIISAITGEKIGMFSSAGGQIFDYNLCVAFSNGDGNTLAISRERSRKGFLSKVTNYFREVIMIPSHPSSSRPNLLIWKLLPDKYVSIFKELQNQRLSFLYMELLVSLSYRAEDNKNPILLTNDERRVLDGLAHDENGLKIKNMLMDTGYILYPSLLPETTQSTINE